MKKIFTLMALMMMAPWVGWGQTVWNGNTDTQWYDYNPEASEFTINTAEELAGLAKLVNASNNNDGISFEGKTIKLGANIVLNENVLTSDKKLNEGDFKKWEPIGLNAPLSFNGTFDGQGHTISGLYNVVEDIDDDDIDFYGLFGYVGDIDNEEPAIIKNVGIIDSYIKGGANDYVSGICSAGQNLSISKCYFDGLITAQNPQTVGVIFASSYQKNYIIESCYNQGNINVSITNLPANTQITYISGIGGTKATHTIYNCYNTGNITVSINGITNQYGMISIDGIGSGGRIASCYNEGDITVSGANNNCIIGTGGISGIGSHSNAEIKYCYNIGEINSTVTSTPTAGGATISVGAGSIIGITSSSNLTKNYYLKTENGKEKGIGGNLLPNGSVNDETDKIEGIEDFSTGEIAWKMREPITIQSLNISGNPNGENIEVTGYGQQLTADGEAIDETPVLLAFSENKGKEVYKLILNVDETESTIYRNAIESNLLPQTTYEEIMEDAAEGQDLVWTNEADEIVAYGNTYTPTEDATLTAKIDKVYTIDTKVEPEEAGTITVSQKKAQEGDEISFTVTANEGYDLASISITGAEYTKVDNNYSFTMPAANVVITATFKATETGGDGDDEGSISTKRYQLFLADRDFYLNDKYDAEGLVLFSRHDKRYAEVGGSFTIYYEKDGEVNAGDYRIFWSKSANGEYKEVKLDEVSGYYQIRNVQSDVYVKIYGMDGFPVANEAIEAQEARAYAQANKIVVITPKPTDVQIISMAGAVVATAQVAGQQEFANLAEGVYIVRMGENIVKLQVRN